MRDFFLSVEKWEVALAANVNQTGERLVMSAMKTIYRVIVVMII